MDDYKKIPFDDPDLCVPDLDDFDQMKEFFLDCAAEYFRYLSSDDMEKMLAALGKRVDVLATPTDDVFISVSPDAVLRQYPDITIDEAIQIRDNACENIWESGGQSDLDEIVWDQIGAEYKSIKSDSHRGLSDVKDAKAKQAVTARRSGTPAQHTVCIQESRIRQPALHLYAKTSQECNRPKRGRQPSTWAYHRADQIASGKARRAGSRFRPAELYGKR